MENTGVFAVPYLFIHLSDISSAQNALTVRRKKKVRRLLELFGVYFVVVVFGTEDRKYKLVAVAKLIALNNVIEC